MFYSRTKFPTDGTGSIATDMERQVHAHKGEYILQGLLFVIAGLVACSFPAATAFNVEIIIGAVLVVTGIVQLALTLRSKTHSWALLSGFLSVAIGVIMIWQPLPVLLALVTLVAIFMTAEGILEMLLSFQFRLIRNWSWMFFSGVVALTLGAILWLAPPNMALLYFGWIVAINLIFYGLSLLMLVWRTES